jgi:hypothetical protein
MKEKPLNYQQQFYLCKYALDMNNLSWDIVDSLPLTDSRFRMDLRAYEHGDIDLANEEKEKLENLHRKNRKEGFQSKWFDLQTNQKELIKCSFNYKYWKMSKEEKDKEINQIFLDKENC